MIDLGCLTVLQRVLGVSCLRLSGVIEGGNAVPRQLSQQQHLSDRWLLPHSPRSTVWGISEPRIRRQLPILDETIAYRETWPWGKLRTKAGFVDISFGLVYMLQIRQHGTKTFCGYRNESHANLDP